MQLQSTLLFLSTLLAATSAVPSNAPKKYEAGQVAHYPGVSAEIRGWAKQGCSANEKPSYTHKVDQGHCYKLHKTQFLSYKLWQPVATTAQWSCTFTLTEDADSCTGFYVAPSGLPATEKDATCDDGFRHYSEEGGEGFLSFRFTCACSDFNGCTIPTGH
ncbi:hypothetical protein MMC07_000227 [Pseudocyphellaria aurata]|nr:hypothetical protein [Pseudocyphellaria aurata]